MTIFQGQVKEFPSLWQLHADVLNEVGPRHAIYSRKSSLDAGGFAEGSGIVLMRCLAALRQIVWPLREHTRVRQYPPAVTAIKISALLPGAILISKSGERLDWPQPGLR